MKAALIPLLTALPGLATVRGSPNTLFKREDPKCDTANAKEVPVENDCMAIATDMIRGKGQEDSVTEPAGKWSRLRCSEQCAISIWHEEGSDFTYYDVMDDVKAIKSSCAFEGESSEEVPYKGEIARGGRTTSVFKGGGC